MKDNIVPLIIFFSFFFVSVQRWPVNFYPVFTKVFIQDLYICLNK